MGERSVRVRAGVFWRERVRPLLVIAFLLGSFRSAVADWNDVPSGSMRPTILEGDRIFVDRTAYDLRVPFVGWRVVTRSEPARGDIVVFWSPVDGRRLVKRVVGVPGDTIAVRDGRVYLNGVPAHYGPLAVTDWGRLDAQAIDPRTVALETEGAAAPHPVMASAGWPGGPSFGPEVVPAGRYFVMGDHRDNSFDSRFWGYLDRDRIVGRARAVALSVDYERWTPRWQRFFKAL
jgi:signal peptidase I